MSTTYTEIYHLIHTQQLAKAESFLEQITHRSDKWHFFYSQLFLKKSWFSAAREQLECAIALNPSETLYTQSLAQLMGRNNNYSNSYHDSRRRNRKNHCICCCDDCDCCDCCDCDISCCDLICLDSCCECMGGDFIKCI